MRRAVAPSTEGRKGAFVELPTWRTPVPWVGSALARERNLARELPSWLLPICSSRPRSLLPTRRTGIGCYLEEHTDKAKRNDQFLQADRYPIPSRAGARSGAIAGSGAESQVGSPEPAPIPDLQHGNGTWVGSTPGRERARQKPLPVPPSVGMVLVLSIITNFSSKPLTGSQQRLN